MFNGNAYTPDSAIWIRKAWPQCHRRTVCWLRKVRVGRMVPAEGEHWWKLAVQSTTWGTQFIPCLFSLSKTKGPFFARRSSWGKRFWLDQRRLPALHESFPWPREANNSKTSLLILDNHVSRVFVPGIDFWWRDNNTVWLFWAYLPSALTISYRVILSYTLFYRCCRWWLGNARWSLGNASVEKGE